MQSLARCIGHVALNTCMRTYFLYNFVHFRFAEDPTVFGR